MTGRLEIHFNQLSGPQVSAVPVVIDVMDANLDCVIEGQPALIGGKTELDLPTGTYLTRARLPSGATIRRTSTVEDGALTEVDIDVHALTGHESLERSALLGPLVRDAATPGLVGGGYTRTWVRRWHRPRGQPWSPVDFDGQIAHEDAHTILYRFPLDTAAHLIQVGGDAVRWRFVALPPNDTVHVAITPGSDTDPDVAVSVVSADERAEALLGYMRIGSVDGADTIAEDLLFGKVNNPIGAAIGAYYLLRVGRLTQHADWVQNLGELVRLAAGRRGPQRLATHRGRTGRDARRRRTIQTRPRRSAHRR
jgi:hypothetical protein